MKRFKLVAFLAAMSLSATAWAALPAGWTYQGCWSPYPGCAGGKHAYTDASGNFYQCGACSSNPNNPTGCYRSGNLNVIGYWCS